MTELLCNQMGDVMGSRDKQADRTVHSGRAPRRGPRCSDQHPMVLLSPGQMGKTANVPREKNIKHFLYRTPLCFF